MSTGAAGPAGREGQPGPAGREGDAGKTGRTGLTGDTGPEGPEGIEGHEGAKGPAGPVGPVGPVGAIVDLTSAQEDLAAAVRLLYGGVRRLVILVAACLIAVIVFGSVHVRLSQIIRDEGADGRQSLKCVVAVLFRQDPPRCPNAKEDLMEEGILPPTFPATTSTTR